ncbi:MAG: rhodanese-like domain-containing protein [Woeseiaceae bacterium]
MSKQYRVWSRRCFGNSRALLAVVLVSMASFAVPTIASADADEQAASQLPAGKQTTLGLYVTAPEAYEMWQAEPGKIKIVDVRTPEELIFVGHPDMAWKIPIAVQSDQWDAEKQRFPMEVLPDFVARVQKVAGPEDTLLVMCRSGGRSAMAVNLLAEAGFRTVYTITDGMEGDKVKDPDSVFKGQRRVNGWKNSGLPWTYDIDPDRMVLPAERSTLSAE